MTRIYVVTQINWQYNDEWNFIEEGGEVGTPSKAFHSKEKAEAFVKEKNIERLRDLGSDLFDYTDDIRNQVNSGFNLDLVIKEIGGKVNEDAEWQSERYAFPAKMTDEKYEKLYEALSLRWWNLLPMETE